MHPTQTEIVLFILFTSLVFAVLVVFLVSLVYINARNNARRQNELLRSMIQTQETERQRIARDLHDEFGIQLLAIKMYVGLLSEPEHQNNHSIEHTQLMIEDAVRDLKLIINNLSPISFAEYGLIAQLYVLKKSLNYTNNIHVEISIDNEELRFSNEFEINLYRMLQEMISNTLKYARAKNIFIAFVNNSNELKVEFKDDGVGFNLLLVAKGFGIKNIEARTRFYNGSVELKSSTASGTTYLLIFDKKKLGAIDAGSE